VDPARPRGDGRDRVSAPPLGVIPAEYRGKFVTEETYEGIRVIRCWLWALPNRRMWQRTLCQISFAVSAVLFALRRPARPDAVIVSSPPFFAVPAGWVFARLRRAPLVFRGPGPLAGRLRRVRGPVEGWLYRFLRGGRWPSTAPPIGSSS